MEELQKIPLASHDSEMARLHRIIKWIIIGWAASMIFMGSVIYSLAFSEYETTTETTTTETTTTEYADSGDYGNAIVGDGDISIGASLPEGDN